MIYRGQYLVAAARISPRIVSMVMHAQTSTNKVFEAFAWLVRKTCLSARVTRRSRGKAKSHSTRKDEDGQNDV